jgi:hypothetical protein
MGGCIPRAAGPAFTPIHLSGKNQAVVYLYLPRQASRPFDIWANNQFITRLYDGGYYPYITGPGELTLRIEGGHTAVNSVTLEVETAQTYYVKLYMEDLTNPFKGSSRPVLRKVANATGEREIQNCQLVSQHGFRLY